MNAFLFRGTPSTRVRLAICLGASSFLIHAIHAQTEESSKTDQAQTAQGAQTSSAPAKKSIPIQFDTTAAVLVNAPRAIDTGVENLDYAGKAGQNKPEKKEGRR